MDEPENYMIGKFPSFVHQDSDGNYFALPSFAEGLPIVLMEALAMECPVVSTNIAAIGELVEHGVNGWLIPPAELDSLVEALRQSNVNVVNTHRSF